MRFLNYSFVRVDVVPGIPGIEASTMTIAAIDEYGNEFDRLTFERKIPVTPIFGY